MSIVKDVVIEMRENPFVREKELGDGVSSFNFTRNAFYDNHWDEQTIKARGLFIDTINNKIICRGYPKFFRYEEQGISKEFLKNKLTFPVRAYLKENGFLGLFSSKNGNPIFATKSQIEGQYNYYFENCMKKCVSENDIKKMNEYCQKNNCTLLFEVVDMVNDPHIIEYKSPYNIILLDSVRNDIEFSKISYPELKELGRRFNVKVKTFSNIFYNIEELFSFIDNIIKDKPIEYFLNSDNKFEGYVLEDTNGYMFKLKTQYYSLWKFMRSVAGSVVKYGDYKHKGRFEGNKTMEVFYEWLMLHKNEPEIVDMVSKNQIINIRNRFFDILKENE